MKTFTKVIYLILYFFLSTNFVFAAVLSGTVGDDLLQGTSGNDEFVGGLGNDRLQGSYGNDIYRFNLGDGQDRIEEYADTDRLIFGDGIALADLKLFRSGSDLIIKIGDTDQINIVSTYYQARYQVEEFVVAGQLYTQAQLFAAQAEIFILGATSGNNTLNGTEQVNNIDGLEGDDTLNGYGGNDVLLGNLGSDTLNGGNGNDRLFGGEGNDALNGENENDYMEGGAGDDVLNGGDYGNDELIGGTGNDRLQGSYGNDIYRFNLGDGQDRIEEYADTDRLIFGDGIALADLKLFRSGSDLIIKIGDTDQINIVSTYYQARYQVEEFVVAGQLYTQAQLFAAQAEIFILGATSGNNTLNGTEQVNNIDGLEGDDTLNGYGGNDVLLGNLGNDTLNGGNGDDRLIGGGGNDNLLGEAGNDTYEFRFGYGQDTVDDAAGIDKIIFGVDVLLKDIILAQVGNDLVVQLKNSVDKITFKNHYRGASYQVENVEIQNRVFTWAELIAAQKLPRIVQDSIIQNDIYTSIKIDFNQPINSNSLTPSDIQLLDQNGLDQPVSSIVIVSSQQFLINFPALLPEGLYTLRVGPDISNASGIMDQNYDGLAGEPDDGYSSNVGIQYEMPNVIAFSPNPLGNGSGNNVLITWPTYIKPIFGVGISTYRIYQSSVPFSDISEATLVKEIPAPADSALVENLITNQNYYVAVTAVDMNGRYHQRVNSVATAPQPPVQQISGYTYNEQGQVLTENGPRADVNDITTYTYNAQSNLATTTNALGHTTHYNSYDTNGNVLSVTDVNNTTTEFTYHERGWLLSSTLKHPSNPALDAITNYEYDAVGQLISTTLPNGIQIFYEYDDARRLKAIYNAINERIEYTLDTEGNRTQQVIKNSSGTILYSVSKVFDELSRVMQVLGNNGQVTDQDYDVNDNPVTSTDGKNHSTQNEYDALNRVQKIIDPKLGETEFTYNAQNQIKSITDARGNTTHYEYDGLGRLLSLNSPDTGITTFTYDDAGNRTSSSDARGVVVNYSYDALNRLTHITYPDASENVQFVYDNTNNNQGIGRLTSVIQNNQQIDYVYDYRGLITQKITSINNVTRNTEYQYDIAGNLTHIIYPSGRVVNYYYNLLGKIDSISTTLNGNTNTLVNNIQYLPFGPANSFAYGNGLTHTQTYDLDYRLTSIQVGGIVNRAYGYDYANNITSIANNLDTTKSQSFNYDELDRLTTALGKYGNLVYSYDSVGNRLSETRNGSTDSYQYENTSNRLTNITRTNGNRNFTYDNAGNPTQRTSDDNKTHNNTFNNANRLSSVTVNSNATATYTYNTLGQRTSKTLANGNKEIYYYDESGQLISVADQNNNTQREYIYWGNQQIALINNNTIYYIHNDHLNTPQVVTNQNQQVVWMGDYEPFGKLAANQLNSIEIFSRFPGQYFDAETGLYQNYFRDYDPSIGGYIESDPIGLSGGINTYSYVLNNPLKYADPYGLNAIPVPMPGINIPPPNPVVTAGAVGVGLGMGFNWGWEQLSGQSPGTSIYNWTHKDEWAMINQAERRGKGDDLPPPPPSIPNDDPWPDADDWRGQCIRLYEKCITYSWSGSCSACLNKCTAQQEWPFDGPGACAPCGK